MMNYNLETKQEFINTICELNIPEHLYTGKHPEIKIEVVWNSLTGKVVNHEKIAGQLIYLSLIPISANKFEVVKEMYGDNRFSCFYGTELVCYLDYESGESKGIPEKSFVEAYSGQATPRLNPSVVDIETFSPQFTLPEASSTTTYYNTLTFMGNERNAIAENYYEEIIRRLREDR